MPPIDFASLFRVKGMWSVVLVSSGHTGVHWLAAGYLLLLPFIKAEMGLSYAETGVLVTVFYVSSFSANFISGPMVDITGRRVLMQGLSLLVGAVALLAFGVVSGFWMLCVLIAGIGISNNLWHSAAISFLSSRYPDNRGYVLSIHAMGASVGDAVAPVIIGATLGWFAWQQTAAVNSAPAFVIAALILILLLRTETPHAANGGKGMSVGDYFSGLARSFKNRAILGLALTAAFRSMAQVGLLMFLPLYLTIEMKVSPIVMGGAIAAMNIGGIIASFIAGALSDVIGRRPIVVCGLSATTVIIVGLTFIESPAVFVAGIAFLGFSMYAIRPVIHSWMMDLVPPDLAGSGTALMFGSQALFSTLTPIIGGTIADRFGMIYVFYFLAALMLASNVMAALLPRGGGARVEGGTGAGSTSGAAADST